MRPCPVHQPRPVISSALRLRPPPSTDPNETAPLRVVAVAGGGVHVRVSAGLVTRSCDGCGPAFGLPASVAFSPYFNILCFFTGQ